MAHEKATHVPGRPNPEKPRELRESVFAPAWDAVDEASWESFPASDPPGRWAGSDRAPTLNSEQEEAPAPRTGSE